MTVVGETTIISAKMVRTREDGVKAKVLIEYVFSAALASEPGNPAGFRHAIESAKVEGWKSGIITEFQNFGKRKVYKIVPRGEVLSGKKILKTRWVFRTKFKEDGSKVYRSRAVVKGYNQIPGVDFTESFAQMANDKTLCTMLMIMLMRMIMPVIMFIFMRMIMIMFVRMIMVM